MTREITYTYGPDAAAGGLDIHLHLTPDEAAALGGDGVKLAEWLHAAMQALVALRGGQDASQPNGRQDWRRTIDSVSGHLITHLTGIVDAAIREHAAAGGSYGDLATALGVAKSSAQRRRDRLTAGPPDAAETWARTGTDHERRHGEGR